MSEGACDDTRTQAVEHYKSERHVEQKISDHVRACTREISAKNNVVIPMKSSIFTDSSLSPLSSSLNLHFYKSILPFLLAQCRSQSWEIRINDALSLFRIKQDFIYRLETRA